MADPIPPCTPEELMHLKHLLLDAQERLMDVETLSARWCTASDVSQLHTLGYVRDTGDFRSQRWVSSKVSFLGQHSVA